MAYFILFVLQSSLLILIVMGIRMIGKKRLSPVFVYILWLAPMLRLFVPFGGIGVSDGSGYGKYLMEKIHVWEAAAEKAELFFEGRGHGGKGNGEGQDMAADRKPAEETKNYLPNEQIVTMAVPVETERTEYFSGADGEGAEHSDSEHTYTARWAAEGVDTEYTRYEAERSESASVSGKAEETVFRCFVCIWMTGTAFLGLYAWKKNRQFICMVKTDANRLEPRGDSPAPAVYKSERLFSPCLAGIIKPFIVVTEKAASDEKLFSYVMLHEMSHYKQKDHIWTLVRNLLCIVYWWNPLVWKGAECCAVDAELACDRRVTAGMSGEQKREYGNALLSLMKDNGWKEGKLYQVTDMAGRRGILKRRIEGIAAAGKENRILSGIIGAVLLLAAAGCGVKPETDAGVLEENAVYAMEENMVSETPADRMEGMEGKRTDRPAEPEEPEAESTVLDYENLEAGYIIFHTEQKIYVFDLVRREVVREITIRNKEREPVSLTAGALTVSDDGFWVYVRPEASEGMYSYSLRYHNIYLVPSKEIETDYKRKEPEGELVWDRDEMTLSYRNAGGEYFLIEGKNTEPEDKGREPEWYDYTDRKEKAEKEYWLMRGEQAGVSLHSFKAVYLNTMEEWSYEGICALSEGICYDEEVQKAWQDVEGMVTGRFVEAQKGKYCLLLTADIVQPGDSGWKEGVNEKYLYVRFGSDKYGNKRWYADGGMRDEEPDWAWWNDHIIDDAPAVSASRTVAEELAADKNSSMSITHESADILYYENGYPYIQDILTNNTDRAIIETQYCMLAYDENGSPLKLYWNFLDSSAESSFENTVRSDENILPGQTEEYRGGWSLYDGERMENLPEGGNGGADQVAYALICLKQVVFEDGTVWNNPDYENWLETYAGKETGADELKRYYPHEYEIE